MTFKWDKRGSRGLDLFKGKAEKSQWACGRKEGTRNNCGLWGERLFIGEKWERLCILFHLDGSKKKKKKKNKGKLKAMSITLDRSVDLTNLNGPIHWKFYSKPFFRERCTTSFVVKKSELSLFVIHITEMTLVRWEGHFQDFCFSSNPFMFNSKYLNIRSCFWIKGRMELGMRVEMTPRK